MIRNLLHYVKRLIIAFIKVILILIPKDDRLILFSAWFGEKYSDSSKYQFEYMKNKGGYKVFWYTTSRLLYNTLRKQNIPVIFSKSPKGIWYQMRAKMLVSSVQLDDFNEYLYGGNCIFLDLDHGFALKEVGLAIKDSDPKYCSYQKFLRKGLNYWMSAPTYWSMDKVRLCYDIDEDHIVRCNKPRIDVLFDDKLKEGINANIDKIKQGRRAIVWMPTHRSCGEKKIEISKLVDFDRLQKICEAHNVVFIIKKHFYHKAETEEVTAYPNIFDVTNIDVDSTVILAQADALISDYSASYIEFLALDRPIILYAFDKEEYLKTERGLFIKLEDNTAGEIVTESESFLKSIERICNDWNDTSYADGRSKARSLYFDTKIPVGTYREHVKIIIDKLITGEYKPDWIYE